MLNLIAQTSIAAPDVGVDLHAIAPEIVLTAALLAVLIIDLFLPDRYKVWNAAIAMVGMVGSGIALATLTGEQRTTLGEMFVIDGYALLFKWLFVVTGVVLILMSVTYLAEAVRRSQGEFYFLLLTAMLGAMVMPSSRDLVALFIALETVSIPGFLMAGFQKKDERGNEASVKFFLFGVLSSAVMLFGISMIYGVTRSTNLDVIANALQGADGRYEPLIFASILLIIVGFGFKVSAVPFHFWAPDTYEGSPVPVTAFLSVASKAAGFAGLMQLTFLGFRDYASIWAPGFAIIALLTMTLGNVVALAQTNMIRLLAYSSIAQAGYILLPFAVVANQPAATRADAFSAAVTYILIYSFMNLGAFAVVIAVSRREPANRISDYEGLAQREPGLAFAMMFFLLSLAGMIPTAGFWAKFFVFRVAIEGDAIWLAAVMVVNTLVGLYYYLSVGAKMYLRPAAERSGIDVPYTIGIAVGLMALIVAAVTVYPDLLHQFSSDPGAQLVR